MRLPAFVCCEPILDRLHRELAVAIENCQLEVLLQPVLMILTHPPRRQALHLGPEHGAKPTTFVIFPMLPTQLRDAFVLILASVVDVRVKLGVLQLALAGSSSRVRPSSKRGSVHAFQRGTIETHSQSSSAAMPPLEIHKNALIVDIVVEDDRLFILVDGEDLSEDRLELTRYCLRPLRNLEVVLVIRSLQYSLLVFRHSWD